MTSPQAAGGQATGGAEELMTRKQVAYSLRTTSAAIAGYANRGRIPEVRDEEGRPRYRPADVEVLRRDLAGNRR